MNSTPTSQCPFHAQASTAAPSLHPLGVWPPGPRAGLTGWGLLRRMSSDLLGTLAAWQQEFGDVVHLRVWPEHEIVVTDPQLARELLVTNHDALIRWERGMRVFSQLHGHSVLIAEGESWRVKRHALNPSFSPKAVQAFAPTIASAAAKALAYWPTNDEHWEIESALTSLTMDVIMQMMFSGDIGEDARIAEAAVRTCSAAANREFYLPASSPDWVPWKRGKRRAIAALKDLIERHLQARLRLPFDAWPDDLLSRLLQLHREDATAWPLQAVRDECMTTFLAGHETAAATLVWWAWCMASNPTMQSLARHEVQRVLSDRAPTADTLASLQNVTQTIKETLRLYPTAPVLISRRCTRAITLGSWQLPEGTMFLIPVHVMHHDPRWFPEPLSFNPQRFADDAPEIPRGAYMPFGTGPRVCLGQHLAMTEMTVVAAMLLQRFELGIPGGMVAPRPVLNITLRPHRAMSLRVATARSQ